MYSVTAGGLLLVPFIPFATTELSSITGLNLIGLVYLGLIGAGLTYVIWLRGIGLLQPSAVSILGFLSPLSATILGWLILNETLNWMQVLGMVVVLASVFIGQYALRSAAK